jgi:hypothetical protein
VIAIRILWFKSSGISKGHLEKDLFIPTLTNIVGYSDANWAGDLNDKRSTSCYCVLMRGILISWQSKKKNCCGKY